MGKSARQLGRELGLSAEETNILLKEEGLLEGEPGDYSVTSKGKDYVTEVDRHRGTGGSPTYNRNWTERYWDDDVLEKIEITEEKKQNAKDIVSERRQQQREERRLAEEEADRVFRENYYGQDDMDDTYEYESEDSSDNTTKVIATVVGVSIAVVALISPKIVRWIKGLFSNTDANTNNTETKKVPVYKCPRCKSNMYYEYDKDYWKCEDCHSFLNKEELKRKKIYLCKKCKAILHVTPKKNVFTQVRCRECDTINTITYR